MQYREIQSVNKTINEKIEAIRRDNSEKLEAMRLTVDEKLQASLERRINDSFRLVNDRLEQVYKGLGEMQNLAAGVGDLKKVLSNVKTRGVLGEVQLGAILSDILAPSQYLANVATVPNSRNFVEFAVCLPGDGETPIYLPIDAKFPADAYMALQDAYDSGIPEQIKTAVKDLSARIRGFAKDIHTKYVEPPYTTEFALMFLPFEGLYAEVMRLGLFEELQQKYRVTVTGPGTMAAILNSLQMGFRTLSLQKQSAEIWEILGSVKTEFEKFSAVLETAQRHIRQVDEDLDKLVGQRTNAIHRRLREIERTDHIGK